ncbi:MAG TPA: PilX N-terminal domain-containing pilus assembly protein [Rhodocyclaceae bacterium]|nr:PilX N-terminal domain-containing pilus assembly protein [Rhodocyclaceae bacterium]HNH35907.1 PilX N-terminal domain-containing pilus assembly protein [Rhodocyclaceae bacterium]
MLSQPRRNEQGAVLVTGLIILVVMTLLVLGMLKTSVLELKIGGIAHTAQQNFANAEASLVKFINDNNGRFSKDCLSAPAGTSNCFCTNPDAAQCQAANVGGNQTTYYPASGSTPARLLVGGNAFTGAQDVEIRAMQIACADDAGVGSGNQIGGGLQAVYIDLQALATGNFLGTSTVHQGIKSPLPTGACN